MHVYLKMTSLKFNTQKKRKNTNILGNNRLWSPFEISLSGLF